MTDRDIMQQALEALVLLTQAPAETALDYADNAIDALRSRLAQPEQEPVGYWKGKFSNDGGATLYKVPQQSLFGLKYRNEPLYTAPPQRKPLTDEKIIQVIDSMPNKFAGFMIDWDLYEFTRAIEAAHGIKENT